MTKQEILDYFCLINEAYNESNRYESLSKMIDELIESEAVRPRKTGLNIPMRVLLNYECECGVPMMKDQPFCIKCGKPVIWDD